MKMKVVYSFVLWMFPFFMTLCVISYMGYTFWIILYLDKVPALYCGRSLTDPLVLSLNKVIPLGFMVHVTATMLSVLRFKEDRIYILLQFVIFVAVSILSVLFGKSIFASWFPGFTLNDQVWWLFY